MNAYLGQDAAADDDLQDLEALLTTDSDLRLELILLTPARLITRTSLMTSMRQRMVA